MELSNEYLALKAIAKEGEPFIATLTQALADDLLSRSEGCRPPHPRWVKEFAEIFKEGTYDVHKEDSDPIVILLKNDNLFQGIQRLNGFVKSKVKSVDLKFLFVDNPEKAMQYVMLQWTPKNSWNWMRREKEIFDEVDKKYKKH